MAEDAMRAEHARLLRRVSALAGPGYSRMSEITSHVYICSRQLSEDWAELRSNSIRGILTLEAVPKAPEVLKRYTKMGITHLQIHLDDRPQTRIIDHFEAGCQFIHDLVSQQRSVLVHCLQGISSSPTMVMAYYLWRLYLLSYKQSLQHTLQIVDRSKFLLSIVVNYVQGARLCVNPHGSFMMQLLVYELRLKRPFIEALEDEVEQYTKAKQQQKQQELGEEPDLYDDGLTISTEDYLRAVLHDEASVTALAEQVNKRAALPSDSLDELPILLAALPLL